MVDNTAAGGMEKSRLAALADGIFAVVMTLLVLDIKIPDEVVMATDADVWHHLAALQGRFMAYAFSFVMLGAYWIGHHFHFHFIRRTDRYILWINLAFLLFVSIIPFSTSLLGGEAQLRIPLVIYGTNLLMLALIFYVHLQYLVHHPKLAMKELTPQRANHIARRILYMAFIPALSVILSFYNTTAALYTYGLMFFIAFVPGKIDRDMANISL